MKKIFVLSALIAILVLSQAIAQAVENTADVNKTTWGDILTDIFGKYPLQASAPVDATAGQKRKLDTPKNWEFNLELNRYIASNTSYEIGEPNGDFTKPLSRLIFPVNTWWMNFDLRRTSPRWSIGGRAGFSMNRNSNGWMEDLDWGTNAGFNHLTNYSRSYCDVSGGMLFRGDVDVNVSDWMNLPPSLELRPLFMFQYQRFTLMTHDGVQDNYDAGTTVPLDGNCISFTQDWYLYMIGVRGSYKFDMNKNLTIKLKGEADWGAALGYNKDHHEQRPGNLWGYINSSGNALYFLTGVDMIISKTITMGAGINYLFIRTSGNIRDVNEPEGRDLWWKDGVKSSSDQLGLTAHIAYAF
jgi:outer membrane protease